MIWTAPAGMELEYGATLDPVLQSCGLGIGCAYVQSLDSGAAVALITEHCPSESKKTRYNTEVVLDQLYQLIVLETPFDNFFSR